MHTNWKCAYCLEAFLTIPFVMLSALYVTEKCVRVCVYAYVRACVCVCVCEWLHPQVERTSTSSGRPPREQGAEFHTVTPDRSTDPRQTTAHSWCVCACPEDSSTPTRSSTCVLSLSLSLSVSFAEAHQTNTLENHDRRAILCCCFVATCIVDSQYEVRYSEEIPYIMEGSSVSYFKNGHSFGPVWQNFSSGEGSKVVNIRRN